MTAYGMALRFMILIRKERRNSDSLKRHEFVHIQQQKDLGFLFYLWKYFRNPRFRADVEAEAFLCGTGLTERQTVRVLIDKYKIPASIAYRSVEKYAP